MTAFETHPGDNTAPPSTAFEALRRFARRPRADDAERCDLCGEAIGPDHRHLLELAHRRVLCACRACALLLDAPAAGGGARRLIPARVRRLADFAMTDAQWESLQVPVDTAYFCRSAELGGIRAYYPSPMGAAELQLTLDAWSEIEAANPVLLDMEPEVEALLVHRSRPIQKVYLAPIDACFQLVGLDWRHWTGISGGSEVRREIDRFFEALAERAKR